MTRGLVIGKFLPIHQGHVALIQLAASQCDELLVSMSYTDHDPIEGPLRFSWIKQIFENNPVIQPRLIRDDFDNPSLAWPERTKIWAEVLTRYYGKIDKVFSSEPYGEFLARHMEAENIVFDMDRMKIPVSATKIRNAPFTYWDFIPAVVRPYFVKKICFYGPESTGKSTMAIKMAALYETEFVPELAREILLSNDFNADDIIRIGYAQTERVLEKWRNANKLLFCDTDLITTQIYSNHYLHVVPDVLYELEKRVTYDLYFLFDVDVAWVADGLRDLGNKRAEMYHVFKEELIKRNAPFVEVNGNYARREERVRQHIDRMLSL
jgi:HTH-type transcriptional regulator, transcriptional repressor of NAD biosynthesis genes